MEIIKTDTDTLRKFGLTMALVCLFLAELVLLKAQYAPKPLVILSLLFITCSFIEPLFLRYFYTLWMRFAAGLAWINTRIILCVLFYGLVTPIGFFQRLFGVDLLGLKIDSKESYWIKKEADTDNKDRYERLF
ncbi:MAG TPA: SxtJ family membrane protein [Candidatus Omnitrophota bacterium]|nr:SxtJ family membrane protein [Candidatus Omnitrophota bacterium]HPT07780.1 SxtJ family membrane protein [Candidatus Omnitrophota bacterium]